MYILEIEGSGRYEVKLVHHFLQCDHSHKTVFTPGSPNKWEFWTFDNFFSTTEKGKKKNLCGQMSSILGKKVFGSLGKPVVGR